MKKVPCKYKDCGLRRRHWCDPYTDRGTQHVEVPVEQDSSVYCSMECAILDGAISVSDRPGSTVRKP